MDKIKIAFSVFPSKVLEPLVSPTYLSRSKLPAPMKSVKSILQLLTRGWMTFLGCLFPNFLAGGIHLCRTYEDMVDLLQDIPWNRLYGWLAVGILPPGTGLGLLGLALVPLSEPDWFWCLVQVQLVQVKEAHCELFLKSNTSEEDY